MEVMVNGKPMQLSEGVTAAKLLEQLGIHPERVVVEVNLTILKRDQLASTALKPGDQVEIVHFVGGGCVVTAKPVTGNQKPDKTSGYWSLVSGYSE